MNDRTILNSILYNEKYSIIDILFETHLRPINLMYIPFH